MAKNKTQMEQGRENFLLHSGKLHHKTQGKTDGGKPKPEFETILKLVENAE